jgi:hypothetical protein
VDIYQDVRVKFLQKSVKLEARVDVSPVLINHRIMVLVCQVWEVTVDSDSQSAVTVVVEPVII